MKANIRSVVRLLLIGRKNLFRRSAFTTAKLPSLELVNRRHAWTIIEPVLSAREIWTNAIFFNQQFQLVRRALISWVFFGIYALLLRLFRSH